MDDEHDTFARSGRGRRVGGTVKRKPDEPLEPRPERGDDDQSRPDSGGGIPFEKDLPEQRPPTDEGDWQEDISED